MKFEVHIEKPYVIFIVLALILLSGAILVYAFNPSGIGGNPAVFGHSADEVLVVLTNGSTINVQNLLKNGLNGECMIDYADNITLTGSVTAGHYISKDCPIGYLATGAFMGGDNAGGNEVEIIDLHCSRLVCN